MPKKRDILSEKRESGMALKKREFTPESGTVDTYDMLQLGNVDKCRSSHLIWVALPKKHSKCLV